MDLRVEPGSCLAAAPDLLDPNFMHTVVLVCAHGAEGAHGVVINRPAPIRIDALMPDHPALSVSGFPVHAGGPVGLDTLQFVHRLPDAIPGGIELSAGVYLGGELDAVGEYLRTRRAEAEQHLRMILGYAGWGAGQLEAELASGAWIPAALSQEWVFEVEPAALWRRVLRSLGREGAGLEDLPPDVAWN